MKRIIGIFLIIFSIFLQSCENDSREYKTTLISAEKLMSVSPEMMRNILDKNNTPHGPIVFGYDAYKIIYETTDDLGNKVIASGLLTIPILPDTIPEEKRKLYSFPVVLNEHGTIFLDNEAPTYNYMPGNNSTFPIIALFTGIYGFATAMPDYIGYGESKDHYHPYMIENSLAQASIDMLKASIDFCEKNGILIKRDAYITGYSEGGYAAMATAKKLQEKPELLINVKAVAPLGGIYDLEKMGLAVISQTQLDNDSLAFVGFLVYAYSKTYSKDIVLNQIIQDPYNAILPQLYDGTKSKDEIAKNLDNDIRNLFDPLYLQDMAINTENPFRKKLRENNTDDWAPQSKMRIVHCGHDNILPFALVELSYNKMLANGATKIELIDPEIIFSALVDNDGWSHKECAEHAYKIAAQWFCVLERGPEKCGQ